MPASRSAAVSACSPVSRSAAGAPVRGLSEELTRTTSPSRTATATRPSSAAGSLPNRCRSSTTVPSPTGVAATFSSASTAAGRNANSAALPARYCRAAFSGSGDRPVASGPDGRYTAAGVPSAFHRTVSDRSTAGRASGPAGFGRLSTYAYSAGSRSVNGPGGGAAGDGAAEAPAGSPPRTVATARIPAQAIRLRSCM
jgi:hypothetical protein